MALPATDTFTTGSDQALTTYSANWSYTGSAAFTVLATTDDVRPNVGSTYDFFAYWDADVFNNNQYAQATIKAEASGVYIGVAVRIGAGDLSGYEYVSDSNLKYLVAVDADGNASELHSSADQFIANDVIRLEANGTTITPKLNGVTDTDIGAHTDSTCSSGYAGICGGETGTSRLDDWEGGNYSTDLSVNKTESISVSESNTVALPDALAISKTESITVSEGIGAYQPIPDVWAVSVSDGAIISEAVTVNLPDALAVSKSEAITVGESSSIEVPEVDSLSISESDAIAVFDGTFYGWNILEISNSESVTVGETATIEISGGPVGIDASETITVGETVAVSIPSLEVSKTETITAADTPSVEALGLVVSKTETVTVGETVAASLPDALAVSQTETITVSDAPTVTLNALEISASETTITVTDAPTLAALGLEISITDGITVTDTPTVNLIEAGGITISVADSATVSETVTAEISNLDVSISSGITVTDIPSVSAEEGLADLAIAITPDSVFAVGVRIYP